MTSTALTEQTALPPVVVELEALQPKMQSLLPAHVDPQRFQRICISALNHSPSLLECTPHSVVNSALTAAQLGLEPDPVLGQAYFVPFNKGRDGKVCQLIIGYKGYLSLMRNSGEVRSIQVQPVFDNDDFEYEYGLHERLRHVPAKGERGEFTHVWLKVQLKDGAVHWDVMSRADVDKRRESSTAYQYAKSKGRKDTPWIEHYEAMACKTIIRKNAKYLPLSVQKASEVEAFADRGGYGYIDQDTGNPLLEGQYIEEQQTGSRPSALDMFEAGAGTEGGSIDGPQG